MKPSLLALASLFLAAPAFSQVVFDNVIHHGAGCPRASVQTTTSPDGTTLSILFDEFRAEVPDYSVPQPDPRFPPGRGTPPARPSRSLRDCMLRFTAVLQPGTMVEAVDISLSARGSTILDPGVTASFASILVGYNGMSQGRGRPVPLVQKQWGTQGVMDDWTEMPSTTLPLRSPCASHHQRSITFDMKNYIIAEIPSGDLRRSGLISVDSADMSGMLRFRFRTRGCGGVR
jgi:hypothetical protein